MKNTFAKKIAELINDKRWSYLSIRISAPEYYDFYSVNKDEYMEGLWDLEIEEGSIEDKGDELHIVYHHDNEDRRTEIKISEEKNPQVLKFFGNLEHFIFFTGETHDDVNYYDYPYLRHLERIAEFKDISMDRLMKEFKTVDFGMISGSNDGIYWLEKIYFTKDDEAFNLECQEFILSFLEQQNMGENIDDVFRIKASDK